MITDDGLHAFAPVQRGGEMGISRIALSGPESYEPVVPGHRVALPVAVRGNTMLFLGYGMFEPGDLYLVRTDGSAERRLTELNSDLLQQWALPAVHHLEFTSADGAAVEG